MVIKRDDLFKPEELPSLEEKLAEAEAFIEDLTEETIVKPSRARRKKEL